MDIGTTVLVPAFIYNIYAKAAEILGNYTTEEVMSSVLQSYAQNLAEEMLTNGELTDERPQK